MRTMMIVGMVLVASGCATDRDPDPDTLALATCAQPPASDSFTLGEVSIEGHKLLIHVVTGGGCAAHTFAACWDGSVVDTNPRMIDLALSHNAHGDTCDAALVRDLTVDLAPVLAKFSAPLVVNVTGATGNLAGTSSSAQLDD